VHQLGAELERLIAAGLRHPSIAAPIASGIHGVWAYVAVDYVTAESLDLVIREYGPAPPHDAVRVAGQLAAALDAAHAAGVTHGALHPRDVLLSTDETRLTGLGLARALEAVGVAPPIRRPYTAPERLLDEVWDRRTADVFSLGALMFELLWGRRLAGCGEQAVAAVGEIAGADMTALRVAFARVLAENPQQRFQTATDFAEAFASAMAAPKPAAADDAEATQPVKIVVSPPVEARLPLEEPDEVPGSRFPVPGAGFAAAENREPGNREPENREPENREPRTGNREPGTRVKPAKRPRRIEPAADAELELRPADAIDPIFDDLTPFEAPPPPAAHQPEDHDRQSVMPPPAFIVNQPEPLTTIDRSRSAVWPLVVALSLGGALGFAAGYGVGARDRGTVAAVGTDAAVTPPPAAPAPQPPGKEFTESTIPEAPKPAPVAQPTAPRPDAAKADAAAATSAPAPRPAAPAPHPAAVTPHRPARAAAPPARPARTAPARTPPAGAKAVLTVESRPSGAKVFIDGRLIGITPLQLPDVNEGAHAIRLERDGYRRWASSVHVVASERNRVTASLER